MLFIRVVRKQKVASKSSNQTLQDKLIKEMILRKISYIEEANAFAQNEYISTHNKRFAVAPVTILIRIYQLILN